MINPIRHPEKTIFAVCIECEDPCWIAIENALKIPEYCLYDNDFSPDFNIVIYNDILNRFEDHSTRTEVKLPEGYLNETRI